MEEHLSIVVRAIKGCSSSTMAVLNSAGLILVDSCAEPLLLRGTAGKFGPMSSSEYCCHYGAANQWTNLRPVAIVLHQYAEASDSNYKRRSKQSSRIRGGRSCTTAG